MNKLLPIILLTTAPILMGCYTQLSSSSTITHSDPSSAPETIEFVEETQSVTINNYYDSYYNRFMRPTIYGFGSVWDWGNLSWDYPLWYQPIWGAPVIVTPYFWGAPYSYNYWNRWHLYPNNSSGGGYASTLPIGTRRIGIGRVRPNQLDAIRQSDNTSSKSTAIPSNVSRRQRTGNAQSVSKEFKEQVKSTSPSRRRQTGTSNPASSYKPATPSSSLRSSSSNGNEKSSSGSTGRRQR